MAFSFLCFSTMFVCYFAGFQVVKTAIHFLKTSVASIFCLFVLKNEFLGSLGTLPELGDLYHKPSIPKLRSELL